MALNTTNVKEWNIISNLSSVFTKNEVPSDTHLELYNTVILTDKLIWFPIQTLLYLCLRNWTDASPMKNDIQPAAADTSLVIPKPRTMDSLQIKKNGAFLLKSKYRFWHASSTCNHPPCSRKRSSAGFTQPTPHRAAEQLLTCWCRESAQGWVPCSHLPAKSWQNIICFLSVLENSLSAEGANKP